VIQFIAAARTGTVFVVIPLTISIPVIPVIPVAVTVPVPVSPIAVSLSLSITITLAITNRVVVAIVGSAVRQETLCHAGLTVVALAFSDGLATVGLIWIRLRTAGPSGARAATMRSLTSAVTVAVSPVTTA
jgi:hypothetical protein